MAIRVLKLNTQNASKIVTKWTYSRKTQFYICLFRLPKCNVMVFRNHSATAISFANIYWGGFCLIFRSTHHRRLLHMNSLALRIHTKLSIFNHHNSFHTYTQRCANTISGVKIKYNFLWVITSIFCTTELSQIVQTLSCSSYLYFVFK